MKNKYFLAAILGVFGIATAHADEITLAQAGALISKTLGTGTFKGVTVKAYGIGNNPLPAGTACQLDVDVDAKTGSFDVTVDNRSAASLNGAYDFINMSGDLLSINLIQDSNKLNLVIRMSYPRNRAEDGTNKPEIGTNTLIITPDGDVVIKHRGEKLVADCKVQ